MAPGWAIVTRKTKAMMRSLEFSVLPLTSPERGEGLEMELVIDHTYVKKRQ